MAYDPAAASRIQLGACTVTFGGVDLGLTKGGVEVAISTETYKVTVDQYGTTSINEYITGRNITVTVPLAETDLTKFQVALPGSTLVTDTTTPTKKKLVVPHSQGVDLLSVADELVLHPYALAPTDLSQDLTVPIAAPKGEFNFKFEFAQERVYAVEFMGYADLTTNSLFVIGDPTATA